MNACTTVVWHTTWPSSRLWTHLMPMANISISLNMIVRASDWMALLQSTPNLISERKKENDVPDSHKQPQMTLIKISAPMKQLTVTESWRWWVFVNDKTEIALLCSDYDNNKSTCSVPRGAGGLPLPSWLNERVARIQPKINHIGINWAMI